jgi:hypothetical protein
MSARPFALIFSIETLSTSANCRTETYHQPRGEGCGTICEAAMANDESVIPKLRAAFALIK